MSKTETQTAETQTPETQTPETQTEDMQILVPSGRTPTSKNALVHGLYASDIVLKWESEEEFHDLFRELKQEWLPQGRQEYETVLSIARCNWLKHRLMRATQICFRRDPFLAELEKAGAKTWADVSRLMDEKATAEDDLMSEVKATVAELKTATKNASALMTASDPNTHEIYRKIETVNDMFFKALPVYQKAFEKLYRKNPGVDQNEPGVRFSEAYSRNPSTLIEQAYHPDYLEKLVRLEASIDARIDKLLQRLMTLKEYKRLAKQARPTKNISSPSIAPPTQTEKIQA
jgi:hypothetical protein